MNTDKLTKEEKSLLLFFECAVVDYAGKLDTAHMNKADFDIAKKWTKIGFVNFQRIASEFLTLKHTHAVSLSEQAFTEAHKERKARAARMFEKRSWYTVEEKRKQQTLKPL